MTTDTDKKRKLWDDGLRERSPGRWTIVIETADPDGKRARKWHTFKGNKTAAKAERDRLRTAVNGGTYVESTKTTVADYVRARIDAWEADPEGITARTAQRYRQLCENQIVPHIGARQVQKLSRLDLEGWHHALHRGGLHARTIGHAHRVLHKALRDAEIDGIVPKNVCTLRRAPKVTDDADMVIVKDVPGFVDQIRGSRLYTQAILGLFTGMRLGEVLALRDRCADLDRGVVKVRETLEETKQYGIRFKPPKTRAGRRDITLPTIAVEALRERRRQLLELRMKLGLGKMPDDALLFPNLEGGPLRPSAVSSDWGEVADEIGMPEVTFHALRHSHASQLIDSGVDIVTISKRLGHSKPSVTLSTYAHLFKTDDSKAALAINDALGAS
jgi:integrase